MSNKEIASILKISEGTVKFHLSNLFTKLGVHDRQSAVELIAADTLGEALLQKSK
jgi:LuxR family maltose regulon positive regulatory protein